VIYGLRVVAIGGGTGLAALLTGLKHFTKAPPSGGMLQGGDTVYFADLAALVTVSDDGGSSGRLRDELQMLPPGDIRNCLLALSSDESLLSSLFQHRFEGNGDLAGHNFGNLFLAALTSVTGDFYSAVRAASHVLAIEGRIFPSTTEHVSLVAELEDGSRVGGETRISSSTQPIRRVSLDPPDCRPLEDSLTALREADLILIGPGSLYTSLIPNLLVPGVAKAISDSKALVVYLGNIMTQPGETTGYGLGEHVEALLRHCPDLELSFVLANGAPVPEATLRRYRSEGADFVDVPGSGVAIPCPVEVHDLLATGEPVRHDGPKTAVALQTLFHRARLAASASS
jgi:uncharacterized cofD-like protein